MCISICEAQILGVPVIATNVGGISSIVENGKDGILFPANAPYTAASLIKNITWNRALAEGLSKQAIAKATERHNPESIGNRLFDIYSSIIQENSKS